MKHPLCFLLLLFSCGFQAQFDSVWIREKYIKKEVMIPMRDGVKLFTCIYSPRDNKEKHPILIMRTPYSVAPYGENRFSTRLYTTNWLEYVKENYIIVMQDVRGRYMSEGQFVDIRPFNPAKKKRTDTDEASDAFDAIEWLVENVPENNGRAGVFGISYPGFYATMAALSNHPALKAVSPQAPVTDWFMGDDFHHNGAFALMDGFSFYSGFGKPRPQPTAEHAKGFALPEKDQYNFYLRTGALKNFGKYMENIVFWKDLMEHPDLDAWWKLRNPRIYCRGLKPAILVTGGTFDAEDCFGAWNLYKAIEAQSPGTSNRLVMGPWFHGGWHRGDGAHLGNVRFGEKTSPYYQTEIELPFFNYHLKNKGDDKSIAEATVFFTGSNQWKKLETWPPSQTQEQRLYFNNGYALDYSAPLLPGSFSEYTSDPDKPVPYAENMHVGRTREYMTDDQRFAARRPDVLVFRTEPLSQDLTLAGTVTADLKVRISTTDADFVVKLIDVFPDDFSYDSTYCCKGVKQEAEMAGYQMLVRAEIMRGRYRNSFEKPEAFDPEKVESVKYALPDVAHTFKKGHRLMVQVQSSWFPLFDRNPQQFVNIYTCEDKDFKKCTIRLYHSAEAPSAIILPVLKQ
jgi:uncharacterized protein